MSGFEIAGVVLGSLPIVVSALQFYIKGASTMQKWRFYARELRSLIRTLETEHAKLQNVCEKLLMGIVPETQIETMINDPLGLAWQDSVLFAKIRLRLWRSFKIFEDNLRDMQEAMEELKSKLGLGPDGKVSWVESSSSIGRLLKGGALVLQRSEYQDLLARLRECISSLESLINMNVELEPKRRRRSQGRLNKLFQDLAGGVYSALQSSITCRCPGLHDVGLRLVNQPITITPDDSDEDVMRMLKLGLAVSYASTALETSGHFWGSIRLWNQLQVQLVQAPQPQVPASGVIPVIPVANKRKRVGFAVSTKTPTMITHTPLHFHKPSPGKIGSLCQAVRNAQKFGAGECCGHITDDSQTPCPKYEVYRSGDSDVGSDWCLVSLKDVLAGEGGPSPPFLYGDRLQLAWVITSSMLQLQGTRWLPGALTHDEIFLVKKDGVFLYREVFVLRRFPDAEPRRATKQVTAPVTTLALGIILIELILGQTIENVHPGFGGIAGRHPWEQMSSYEAARHLLDKVNTFGGPNYHNAVSRCIKGNLYDGPNSTDIFSGVLGLLEKDLELAVG